MRNLNMTRKELQNFPQNNLLALLSLCTAFYGTSADSISSSRSIHQMVNYSEEMTQTWRIFLPEFHNLLLTYFV